MCTKQRGGGEDGHEDSSSESKDDFTIQNDLVTLFWQLYTKIYLAWGLVFHNIKTKYGACIILYCMFSNTSLLVLTSTNNHTAYSGCQTHRERVWHTSHYQLVLLKCVLIAMGSTPLGSTWGILATTTLLVGSGQAALASARRMDDENTKILGVCTLKTCQVETLTTFLSG